MRKALKIKQSDEKFSLRWPGPNANKRKLEANGPRQIINSPVDILVLQSLQKTLTTLVECIRSYTHHNDSLNKWQLQFHINTNTTSTLFNSITTEVPIIKKPLHWFAEPSQWSGFYLIGTSAMKKLNDLWRMNFYVAHLFSQYPKVFS